MCIWVIIVMYPFKLILTLNLYRSSIRKINAQTTELVGTFSGHSDEVSVIAMIKDDESIVLSASTNGEIIIWNHVSILTSISN